MTVAEYENDGSALLSRLKVIEDQPLESRAEHLAQVYEELRATLESGDARGGETRPTA
ncbi:hypothetical protein [Pseudolysinimonas yzui]|uniref:Uncharacterized protein n=1 Tax=Pseudolysinimonas yzui TaxID=2708254 RepID=A0A8J3GPB2_9MICO|nr:hypothetical protein [Pseudolysinimonas yzui]GHF10815.1 hypothetical protein GCM10011600_09960 [Pseudolysinimonas yzui]